jgi:Putative DNA-binding domain
MWNRERIEQLIRDGVEESLSLEYKSGEALGKSDGKKAEMVKDVSAFANSSGGTLIYGVAEFQQRDQRHRPEKIDPINRQDYSKEWLEQIIQSIQPRIEGIVIEPVDIDSATVCYVVTIPQSHTAHQARDHVYYRRHNFNVLPMEDYELRDVMNRRKRPRVRASILAVRNTGAEGNILVKLENIGPVLAKDYMVDLQVPIDLGGHISVEKPASLESRDGKYFYMFREGPNVLRRPIFPDSNVLLRRKFSTGVSVKTLDGSKTLASTDSLIVAVYVDEMPPIRATVPANEVMREWVIIGSHD